MVNVPIKSNNTNIKGEIKNIFTAYDSDKSSVPWQQIAKN